MKSLTLNSKIWLVVTFIHLVGLACISTSSAKKSAPKRLAVVTKYVAPQAPVVVHSPVTNIIAPIKKKLPPPAKPVKLKKAKPTHPTSKQVLKKIDKRLIKTPPPKPQKPLPSLPPPQEEHLPTYVDSACSLFRDLLVLPEKGLVKLTITVQANGKIDKVEIETFESKKNLDYLMTVLPTLSLPIPEGGKDATFTVLFCND